MRANLKQETPRIDGRIDARERPQEENMKLDILDISLTHFDGEGGAPAGESGGTDAAGTNPEGGSG